MKTIEQVTQQIKTHSGIELTLCDYFTGIRQHNGKSYFNVILPDRVSESQMLNKLLRACDSGIINHVEPNGVNRLAIYFN